MAKHKKKDAPIRGEFLLTAGFNSPIIPAMTEDTQDIRTKLNKICKYTRNGVYQHRWKRLYQEFYYEHRISITDKAKRLQMNRLDYADKEGYLDQLYEIAVKLWGQDTDPLPPPSTPVLF